MPPELFSMLSRIIEMGGSVSLFYTDRNGIYDEWVDVYPLSFYEFPETDTWLGSVNLWAFHAPHNKKEQFNVERIEGVEVNLVKAVLDSNTYSEFWYGFVSQLQ